MRSLFDSVFYFLIEEGEQGVVDKFLEENKELFTDLFGCYSEVFFNPSGDVDLDYKLNSTINKFLKHRILPTIKGVLKNA